MVRLIVLFLLNAVLLSALTGCGSSSSADLREGLDLYRQNRLEDALPLFQSAAAEKPKNGEIQAWTAETLRRLRRRDEAYAHARTALVLESCSSFAHAIMGDLYNPQFGAWNGKTDAEVAWEHYRQAVECDPDDGNAWLNIWSEALRRGHRDRSREAIRRLGETGFFTPAVLAYNRWMLRDLPEGAVLLVNGDMDTYPALVLQETEGFRTDVTVVNLSLLNTAWYRDRLAEDHGLPFPDGEIEPYQDEAGETVLASRQVVRGWLAGLTEGSFPHPLAASVTVMNLDFSPDSAQRRRYSGAFYLLLPSPSEELTDLDAIGKSLDAVRTADFQGAYAAPADRSAVRQAYSSGLSDNLVATALRYARALLDADRVSEAKEAVQWAKAFKSKVPGRVSFDDALFNLENDLQGRER